MWEYIGTLFFGVIAFCIGYKFGILKMKKHEQGGDTDISSRDGG